MVEVGIPPPSLQLPGPWGREEGQGEFSAGNCPCCGVNASMAQARKQLAKKGFCAPLRLVALTSVLCSMLHQVALVVRSRKPNLPARAWLV
eukprot:CAMPEP_0179088250 /NCGR_PEP_ID=MMETSP0796-20121207/40143_1 /TAXON_ID=73915 /ORGANISM="Pyrodinium bahamense, Strain pbaha01" /LENGTH=90 /DNA_ID=CAMNT_0020785775 /DNA_START=44 /DNA_END=312 /DNA_ORIENTATION=+